MNPKALLALRIIGVVAILCALQRFCYNAVTLRVALTKGFSMKSGAPPLPYFLPAFMPCPRFAVPATDCCSGWELNSFAGARGM